MQWQMGHGTADPASPQVFRDPSEEVCSRAEEGHMPENESLDRLSRSLARIAAAIAIGAAPEALSAVAAAGLSAGATEEQIVGTLFTAAPVVGSARLVRAAPVIACAVGYDMDQALENLD